VSGTAVGYVRAVNAPEGVMAWLLAAAIVLAGIAGIGGAGYVRACKLLLELHALD
jgi:hypothetical protein